MCDLPHTLRHSRLSRSRYARFCRRTRVPGRRRCEPQKWQSNHFALQQRGRGGPDFFGASLAMRASGRRISQSPFMTRAAPKGETVRQLLSPSRPSSSPASPMLAIGASARTQVQGLHDQPQATSPAGRELNGVSGKSPDAQQLPRPPPQATPSMPCSPPPATTSIACSRVCAFCWSES
jgi:hypothetical protein